MTKNDSPPPIKIDNLTKLIAWLSFLGIEIAKGYESAIKGAQIVSKELKVLTIPNASGLYSLVKNGVNVKVISWARVLPNDKMKTSLTKMLVKILLNFN